MSLWIPALEAPSQFGDPLSVPGYNPRYKTWVTSGSIKVNMGFNSPYKAIDLQAIVPRPELTRLITYSTRLDDAALPHVFQISSGIEPAGSSLTMGGVGTEFGMLGEGNGNGSSSIPNAGGTNNGNAGTTQYNRDTIPVFYAAQDDDDGDDDGDEDYDGVVVGCDVEQWWMMFAPNNPYNKEMAKCYEAERLHRLQNWLTGVPR